MYAVLLVCAIFTVVISVMSESDAETNQVSIKSYGTIMYTDTLIQPQTPTLIWINAIEKIANIVFALLSSSLVIITLFEYLRRKLKNRKCRTPICISGLPIVNARYRI